MSAPLPPPPWRGTLAERGGRCLLPTYARYPLELAHGRGCRVTDSGGREYLDFVAGIAVNALGHGHPALVAALRDAAAGLWHVSNLYWTEPGVRFAERLTAAAEMERAFFCNSGAEAVEAALKLARRARPGRPKVAVFDGSFHGRTFGALSATARERYQEPFRPLVPGFEVLPFGDFAAAEGGVDTATAAVLVEPVQGEGGVRPAPAGWLAHLRRLCDREGALLLFDEVQCGMGRTGTLFAYQGEGVRPDALAAAKALAGGLPMGALLARGTAAAAFLPGDHASTFGGGPLVAGVAAAVLEVLLGDGFLEAVRERGRQLERGLAARVERFPTVVGARGRGLLQGLVLAGPWAARLVEELLAEGVLTAAAGPDVVRFVPPLVVAEAEVAAALAALDRALERLPEPTPGGTG